MFDTEKLLAKLQPQPENKDPTAAVDLSPQLINFCCSVQDELLNCCSAVACPDIGRL